VVVDQHFIERGRIARLLALMAARGLPLGLGVEEDSAALVRGDEVLAIGRHGVLVVEMDPPPALKPAPPAQRSLAPTHATAPAAPHVPGPGQPLALRGARLHWLAAGDRFDLRTRQATPAPGRTQPLGVARAAAPGSTERPPPVFTDLLGPGVLLRAMRRLVEGPDAEVLGLAFDARAAMAGAHPGAGFEFRLQRLPGTRGWASPDADEAGLTGLGLAVRPVTISIPLVQPWPAPPAAGQGPQ
jgi:cyanophycinase